LKNNYHDFTSLHDIGIGIHISRSAAQEQARAKEATRFLKRYEFFKSLDFFVGHSVLKSYPSRFRANCNAQCKKIYTASASAFPDPECIETSLLFSVVASQTTDNERSSTISS
jgi:hypothetical protein